MRYIDRILDELKNDVILAARRTMLGLPEGSNSSLALLGPGLVDAMSDYGLRVHSPYNRRGRGY